MLIYKQFKNSYIMKVNSQSLIGSVVNFGSDPFLVENLEQAEDVFRNITLSSSSRVITNDNDEFKTVLLQLDLSGNSVAKVYSFVNGSEFLVCFSNDWNF